MLMPRARDKASFIVGVLLVLLGGIPLGNWMGLFGFSLPGFLSGMVGSIAIWIIAIAGAYVFVDGLVEPKTHSMHWVLILVGLVLLLVGLIPILHNFGVVGFSLGFLDSLVVYNAIITLEGVLLVIGGLTEH